METLLRRLTTAGITRGFGGSRPWMIVGMVAVGMRAVRRMANPAPEVLYRTRVKAGDVFEITSTPSLTRRQRKRAAKRGG